ncbi:hypothetical protein BDZ94DRAFT_1297323 [Collybia nuda]|uniref:Uncharacterized protein n=1 Tax=Collybia nuda TaxID=64659 RepID=A0A9P5Y9K4_9AGAR|nr:hypothetical protein BDZ94DRAFT_1297323 [Collybia nuda]
MTLVLHLLLIYLATTILNTLELEKEEAKGGKSDGKKDKGKGKAKDKDKKSQKKDRVLNSYNWIIMLCTYMFLAALLPQVKAAQSLDAFPDISFREFSQFINNTFSSGISLATVLAVLFTLTSNPNVLNLHARQQNPQMEERAQTVTAWMNALSRALQEKIGPENVQNLFQTQEGPENVQNLFQTQEFNK